MFPVYFVLTTGLGRQEGLALAARMGLTALGNVLLFAGLPLAFLWFGRVRLATSLRWQAAGPTAWVVAGLLGLSLWPWAHELILLLRWVGLASLRPEQMDQLAKAMQEWRTVSPIFLVLVLAVVPAVLEELFFRGFLFSALAGEEGRAGPAIVGSAVLFALFHILVPGGLAVERLVSSLVMGLVLGWLAWASGSVLPGMVLHVLHNSVVVLAGYYEPRLIEAGWPASAHEHLPGWVLVSSGLAAVAGLATLAWLTRRRSRARVGA
jgi:ABC-2 type transport system permease protein/sodium transport system permease protein